MLFCACYVIIVINECLDLFFTHFSRILLTTFVVTVSVKFMPMFLGGNYCWFLEDIGENACRETGVDNVFN